MKNIIKIIFLVITICLIPFSIVAGQEKKNEQKIKIVVSDGSGTKVIIDTVLKDGNIRDSIRLKDGKVIFIGPHKDKTNFRTNDGTENVTVTVSSDGKETKKEVKEITVISSDSESLQDAGNDGKIYVYNNSKGSGGKAGGSQNIMTWSDKDGKESDEKIIILNDGKVIGNEVSDSFEYRITTDKTESDAERTKYVISKDGMVISVEGNDYEKVKELVKEIESKLNIKKEVTENSAVKKEESKKAVKKK